MKVKRYLAPTMPAAMSRVRSEMGPEALILHTRRVRVRGLAGILGKTHTEVTAAIDDAPVAAPRPEGRTDGLAHLQDELAAVKTIVARVARRLEQPLADGCPPGLRGPCAELLAAEIDRELLADLVESLGTTYSPVELAREDLARAALRERIEAALGVPEPIEPGDGRRVFALVGPTGVGKTTTLAKLAARYALGEKIKVGLVTADTYRIAAVEQLKTYGSIMGIPVAVAYTPGELGRAVDGFRDKDLVLIDTAGRSHRNEVQMAELKGYLEAANPDGTYLVLAMNSGVADVMDVVDSYNRVGYDRLLFTKLDESSGFGLMLNVRNATRKPLSYFTTGQNVPDDIEVVDPRRAARLILT